MGWDVLTNGNNNYKLRVSDNSHSVKIEINIGFEDFEVESLLLLSSDDARTIAKMLLDRKATYLMNWITQFDEQLEIKHSDSSTLFELLLEDTTIRLTFSVEQCIEIAEYLNDRAASVEI